MTVRTARIERSTRGDGDTHDLTADVRRVVGASGLRDGVVHLFVVGSTAGLTTLEFEPGCVTDLDAAFERVAPRHGDYRHHERWGDHNGHSHVRAAMLGPHLTVPFVDGELTLGTWQQVVLVDFDDRPRDRTVIAQLIGD